MTFRVAAGTLVVLAVAAAAGVTFGTGVGPFRLARWLGGHGGPEYPLWIGWTLVAPIALVAAATPRQRAPWLWITVCALHLIVVAAGVARVAHLAPWWLWAYLVATVAAGAASIVIVGARRES